MGKPSEQIKCEDWTAAYALDDAAMTFGGWVDNEVKRYAGHTPEVPEGSKKNPKPPSLEHVIEYQRALIDGTPFRRIVVKKRLPIRRKHGESPP